MCVKKVETMSCVSDIDRQGHLQDTFKDIGTYIACVCVFVCVEQVEMRPCVCVIYVDAFSTLPLGSGCGTVDRAVNSNTP